MKRVTRTKVLWGLVVLVLAWASPFGLGQVKVASASNGWENVKLSGDQRDGLKAMQQRISSVVKRLGAEQISINEVQWHDGRVIREFSLPKGTAFLRGLPRAAVKDGIAKVPREPVAAKGRFLYGCPYSKSHQWVCLYEHVNFNGWSRNQPAHAKGGDMLKFRDVGTSQSLKLYDFENRTSSFLHTTSYKVLVYDWMSGDRNCGNQDSFALQSSSSLPPASPAKPRSRQTLGAANDRADCIWIMTREQSTNKFLNP